MFFTSTELMIFRKYTRTAKQLEMLDEHILETLEN